MSGVHGIWNYQYLKDAAFDMPGAIGAIGADWSRWVGRGLRKVDAALAPPGPIPVAYYSDCLFRGVRMGGEDPRRLTPFGQELLAAWIEEVRLAEVGVAAAPLVPQGRLTFALRSMVQWFTERFGQRSLRIVSATVGELAAYFDPESPAARLQAQDRVATMLRCHRPRVLLAHSLGSVVAYETLSAHPDLEVDLFVTMGSPLAMRTVVFERLSPVPQGRGAKPPGAAAWVNIADRGDPVAVPRHGMSQRFIDVVRDRETSIHLVDPHTAKNYLRCAELVEEILPHVTTRSA
ncbi:hypothetical protein OG735_39895 [Streptomyces sp. NBC_01210]|uniref:hypothetical protein n=1 Tax=Streptomyces sp. NBC_01210 TaxID=2903774 RepID=UPI002E0FC1D3|nr:hypothetical protein OG735_39895 [Streptomyces sp. NBC_01210]